MKIISLFQQTAILAISSAVLLTPLVSEALTVEEVTNPKSKGNGWVTDMADILSDKTEIELNRLITNLEETNGAEIAVVTVPETAPASSPKAFATQLFNHWGIGKAESDNGILFLISTADRRVEIETGYGIEGILPDALVANIIDTKITPQYKQNNYDRGTLDGTTALIEALESSAEMQTSLSDRSSNILFILTGIGLTSVAGGFFWWGKHKIKVFIDPYKTLISLKRSDFQDVHCAKCERKMSEVDNIKLTPEQQVAEKIGSVNYRGYKCSSCSNALQPYSLIRCISHSSRYQECHKCQELTVTRTKIIWQEATYSSTGKLLVKDECHCCDYLKEKTEVIPRLRRTKTNSSNTSSKNRGGSYSSYSSGDSSSGEFGGGSSDGGGAGGDW